jgi:hypothetical protein
MKVIERNEVGSRWVAICFSGNIRRFGCDAPIKSKSSKILRYDYTLRVFLDPFYQNLSLHLSKRSIVSEPASQNMERDSEFDSDLE